MDQSERNTRIGVALGVVLLHACGVRALLTFDVRTRGAWSPVHADAAAVVIEFIPASRARMRSSGRAVPPAPAARGARPVQAPRATVLSFADVADAGRKDAQGGDDDRDGNSSGPPSQPLDLRIPETTSGAFTASERAWLERAPALDPRRTRFARAWVPAGTAIDQARFRSPALDAALGLFGAPPRRCSEVERRLRLPDCLALDADAADLEALRRSVD